ncbi:MAG: YqzL family protein [Clostridia bacterium]|nr:YqzL family protein [Clostridia bacterium]MBQ8298843.1 YqzL family protein [Clostridia bacterium]
MSKDFAWQLFKNTGNVDAFMIMRDIENAPTTCNETEAKNVLGDINGDSKNEGYSN